MIELPGTGASVTPGAALRQARQAAGLSVAEVAVQMRLAPRQVDALEADRYSDLPGAVFVRGFVRNYARVLKLDPVPLLHALEPALGAETPLWVRETSGALPVSARRDRSKALLVVLGVLFLAALVAGGYELWSRQKDNWKKALDPANPTNAPSVQGRPALESAPQSSAPTPPHSTNSVSEAVRDMAVGSERPDTALVSVGDPAPQTVSNLPGDTRIGRISLQFTAASWVEVRDREGRLVYSGTGHAGVERTLEAQPPIAVVIGNARAVRITYNDRAVDVAAHAERNIARFSLE
jgi:cytoskeleton protein RodZ